MPGFPTTLSPLASILSSDADYYQDAGGKWLTADEIAKRLTMPRQVPNPEKQPTIPVPLNVDQAIDLLSSATCAKLSMVTPIIDFVQKVNDGDRAGAMRWIVFAGKAGLLVPTELQALASLAASTMPDPTWPATITIPPAVTRVNVRDIEAAIQEIANNVG